MQEEHQGKYREKFQDEQRKEPSLGSTGSENFSDSDYLSDERDDEESHLSITQKIMMGISAIVTVIACLYLRTVPLQVKTQLFDLSARTSTRVSEMLQWNIVFVVLPVLILLVSFISSRSSSYLGLKMLLASVFGFALLLCIAALFSYFVLAVAA